MSQPSNNPKQFDSDPKQVTKDSYINNMWLQTQFFTVVEIAKYKKTDC